MKPPDEQKAAAEAALVAAERALATGRLRAAQRLLNDAARIGGHQRDVHRLQRALQAAQEAQAKRERWSGWAAFGIGLVCYLVLSAMQPAGWTPPVWIALAFVVTPGLIGWLTGRWQGPESEPRARFWSGLWAGGGAMFLYTGVWLILLRTRIGGGDLGQVMLLWCLVTGLYALLAGLVAGIASARLTWRAPKGEGA